ncbi:MAG: hypothetical protein ACJ0HN_01070 [Alphaproteobacteria bacterium]
MNATVGDNVKIGAENVIGAWCHILKDTADKAVFPLSKRKYLRYQVTV